ncbi:uncharacterized protein ACBR49_011271 [Aulostomus maculatus]
MSHIFSPEEARHLQAIGKFFVNENCLLQLFRRKCPLCGGKLQTEKVVHGVLVILNQQCLQCEYRNQWKSQVNAGVPTDCQHVTRDIDVSPEGRQADEDPGCSVSSEIVTFSDEESDPADDGEQEDGGRRNTEAEWSPLEDLLDEELTQDSEEEVEADEEEEFVNPINGLKTKELCTECGCFFSIKKPHKCDHKTKLYSCNICGKRCVSEISLKTHSRIHSESYEHPCKFCCINFKTRVDKLQHERTHQGSKKPYKCPDCSETFASNIKRKVHLAGHRGPKEFKCDACGISFTNVHYLQRHSVVHTGVRPFTCSVCQRGFNQASHLKSHMRLHIGERPYKCRHCDKRFNHNVSLKSHTQRYHASRFKQKNCTSDEGAIDRCDTEENWRDKDSEFVSAEGTQEVHKKKTKNRMRSTGRPRGRPKRDAEGNLVLTDQTEHQGLSEKTGKKSHSNKESDASFDSAEEEDSAESRRRSKKDSDSDFDPEDEAETKRCGGRSSGKPRGKPKKKSE